MTGSVRIFMFCGALVTIASNLLIRRGVDHAGGFPSEIRHVPMVVIRLISHPSCDVGFGLYVIASLVLLRIVATGTLNLAYPGLSGGRTR